MQIRDVFYSRAVMLEIDLMTCLRLHSSSVPLHYQHCLNIVSCTWPNLHLLDANQDFFELLNFPESPEHLPTTPVFGEHAAEENGSTPTSPFPPTNMKTFQKDILKLMMEGIKIGLVCASRFMFPICCWGLVSTFQMFPASMEGQN